MKMNVQEMIKALSEKTGKTQKELKDIVFKLDEVVCECLAQASETEDVEIKILPSGVTLLSEYVAAHEARNPQDGSTVTVPGKNRVRAKLGKGVKDAVNN